MTRTWKQKETGIDVATQLNSVLECTGLALLGSGMGNLVMEGKRKWGERIVFLLQTYEVFILNNLWNMLIT